MKYYIVTLLLKSPLPPIFSTDQAIGAMRVKYPTLAPTPKRLSQLLRLDKRVKAVPTDKALRLTLWERA